MGKLKLLWMVGLLLFLSNELTFAQVNTGTISGTVKDSTGAVLPGTKVVILNEETGISRTISADAAGHYSALSLSVGNYEVTGTQEGFQTEIRKGIMLTVGREAIVDLTMQVGSVAQTVEVTGEAPLVEATTATLGSLVDERTMRALPLNGRSYDQLALLQPGVILALTGQTSSTTFTYGSGKRFSVGGQRPTSNSFLLDGTDINDEGNGAPGGAAGTNLGVDTIREFKIFTSSFKAEYGHSNGSVTSAITRSGTNNLHGTAFEYLRNSALDARNFFDVGSSPPSFKRNQFGGVLGGPIKKDKTFVFGGYEGLRQGLGTTLIATVPTALARQGILPTTTVAVNPASVPILNLYPLPNGRNFGDGTGEYLSSPTIATNEDNLMIRVDHQLNSKTSIFGRYTFDRDNLNAPQMLPNQLIVNDSRRQYATLQANTILNPKALNNFRFAFNRSHTSTVQNTVPDPGPLVSIVPGQPAGAFVVGAAVGAGNRAISPFGSSQGAGAQTWAFNIFQWGDDFSYVTGKHSFKVGVDLQRLRDNVAIPLSIRGQYTFSTFNDLLTGTPSNLLAASPLGITPDFGFRQNLIGTYAQDDYAVNSRLTLNLGLRWETTTDPYDVNGKTAQLPSPAATSTVVSENYLRVGKANFEPRVGLAWQLNSSGKTVLRAGGGIYHNQILPWLYYNDSRLPPFFFGKATATNPPFPNGYQILQPGVSPQLTVISPYEKTPVNDQYNLSIQQQISKNTIIQVAYAGNKANHIVTLREADTPVPTILSNGQPFYPVGAPRRNPAWSGLIYSETNGNSDYNSMTVTLRRQSSTGFVGQIFYTYSKAMDESSSNFGAESVRSPNATLDPANLRRDWGLADFDSRNAVVANFSYPIPFRTDSKALGYIVKGWTLDGIGTFTSGMPFTARLSAAVSRDLASIASERPDLKPGSNQNPNQGTSVGCSGFAAGTKLGGADNFYDPCSFALPLAGTYGNVGRNTITGPGVADVDLALEKNFKLREQAGVTFRAEMFDIMNHANLGLPNTSALTAAGTANPAAGRITYTTTNSRQLQFALRVNF